MPPRAKSPLFTFRLVPLVGAVCAERGVDAVSLVRNAGLPDEALKSPEVTAPLDAIRKLLGDAAAMLDDDAFGLTLAERVPEGTYALLEFSAKSALTLREGFESLARFAPLVNLVTRFDFEEDAGEGRFSHRTLASRNAQGRELHEFTLALLLAIARAQTGTRFFPRRTWFAHPRPASLRRLEATFGPKLEFEAGASGYAFDKPTLDLPLASADPALKGWLDAQARDALEKLPPASDVAGRVRAALSQGLGRGQAEMRSVAEVLKVSERTLQRRLADEGTSFAQVLEELRRALSQRYLADPRLSVGEIAYLLGYSELRAFDRAFTRWWGQTPHAWRKRKG